MNRSLAAALSEYDAFNGLVPPIWGCPVPKRSGHDVDVLRWADEVIDSDADHDDGCRGVDTALYHKRQPCPSWFEVEVGADLAPGSSPESPSSHIRASLRL